ncbi:MAG: fructosamine kinase family protein, partial [Anaerolineae bacterium]|nr:fructosamine kinase family protein [Anaerolineae bacterium]
FDPMASFGLRESDIAIAKQGKGIPECFYDAYDEAYPLPEGWRERLEMYYLHIAIAMIGYVGGQPRYVEMLRELLDRFT